MNRIPYSLLTKITFILSVLVLGGQSPKILAQNNSQEFFDQGDEQIEQDTQMLEQQQQEPTMEQKEQNLDQELNINRQDERDSVEGNVNDQVEQVSPDVEDVPGPGEDLRLDDNLPSQPADEEVEIKL